MAEVGAERGASILYYVATAYGDGAVVMYDRVAVSG